MHEHIIEQVSQSRVPLGLDGLRSADSLIEAVAAITEAVTKHEYGHSVVSIPATLQGAVTCHRFATSPRTEEYENGKNQTKIGRSLGRHSGKWE